MSLLTLYIAPTGRGVGLTSISLGLVRALDRVGVRVHFLKPIAQFNGNDGTEPSTHFIRSTTGLRPPDPINIHEAQELLSAGQQDTLMELIVERFEQVSVDAEVVIVEGLVPVDDYIYADQLNGAIARTLGAEVLLVTSAGDGDPDALDNRFEIASQSFGGVGDTKVIGGIINKANVPQRTGIAVAPEAEAPADALQPVPDQPDQCAALRRKSKLLARPDFHLVGCVPWQQELVAPRTLDVADYFQAQRIHEGDLAGRRITQIAVCARTMPNMSSALRPGVLIVTPGDRDDIVLATCMAALNGVPLAGLLLTSGIEPDARVMKLGERALETGLPILLVPDDTYLTVSKLQSFNPEVPWDDLDRVESVMDFMARHMDTDWLRERLSTNREPRMSPAAFRHQISQRAKQAHKRIILPEGNEPRTICAAAYCQEHELAQCVLVGEREEILRVAETQGVTLPDGVEIIEPSDELRRQYVPLMVELRKHKGLTAPMAEQYLEDNVVLATMMLARDEVDGLVSGAVHTTANTIRPALQFIKTAPDAKLVSSVFFMLLPEQVLVYGDCAVNPEPNAEELADIAAQSAESAEAFGITPRIAMISYSTGSSGAGADVEKVQRATELARKLRPDLLIDGPLQYDAAAIPSVAKAKAPESRVAGRATVFIFPDLNTGNTTYKAVQRSAGVVSIGPVLQGLKKPVNDLSRGSLVDDIIYTIAVTAVQAARVEAIVEREAA